MPRGILILFLFLTLQSFGQDSIQKKNWKDYLGIRGYVKYMNSASFVDPDAIITNNFFHNRVNFKGYISKKFEATFEVRNRLFYGETVRLNPLFAKQLGQDRGLVDASFVLIDKNSVVLHSMIDRAYLSYSTNKWDVRVGRQRINWGINMAWNPNDLFNAYNIIDFDYQERPGADAIRAQHYLSDVSSFEIAGSPTKYMDSSVVAALYKFNKKQYDFQLLAGNYFTDVALGGGWAGNLKNAGFKGEATYFIPRYYPLKDTSGVLSGSMSFDYSFGSGIYVNASYLFNSKISTINANGANALYTGALSPKFLLPSKHTYFVQASGAFNPQIGGGMSVFYAQTIDLLFFMPSISVSITDNWNLDFFGQTALLVSPKATHYGTGIFLRLMYSY